MTSTDIDPHAPDFDWNTDVMYELAEVHSLLKPLVFTATMITLIAANILVRVPDSAPIFPELAFYTVSAVGFVLLSIGILLLLTGATTVFLYARTVGYRHYLQTALSQHSPL
jgi:hypothetical protein